MQQTQVQGQQPGESQGQGKRRKWLFWVRLVSFIIALLLILVGAAIWILNSLGSMTNLFTAIFAILGALFAFFALSNLFFPSNKPIIINVPPSQAAPPPPSTPPEKPAPRSIIGLPPLTDPRTIEQREKAVKDVYAKLTQPDISAVVLTGIGGVGKSTLAALVYRYAEEQRRAGNGLFAAKGLWLKLDALADVTLADLAGTLLEELGKPVPDLTSLTPQNQAMALYTALNSTDEPRLVILDQFENLLDEEGKARADRPGVGEGIDILNNQPCRCRVLLTSRPRPQGTRRYPLTYMQEYPVEGLEAAEGIALLRKQGVEAAETELRTAIARCEGHAFALTLLAFVLHDHRLSLRDLLKDPTLWTGDIASNFLDRIYKQQLSEEQRKLLLAFSVYREPVPLDAAQAIIDFGVEVSEAQMQPALNILLTQHLLQASGGRYQLHAIVAGYAQDHFVEGNKQANRQAVQAAHAGAAQYYLQLAASSCPARDKRHAIDDVRPLIEAVWQLCQAGQCQEAYDLMEREGIASDLNRWGGNVILLELYQLLLSLEVGQLERLQAALIYNNLGAVYNALGQKEQTLRHFEQALGIYREVGDRGGEGTTLNNLGGVYDDLGQKEQALRYYEQALGIRREVGDRGGEGTTLNNLGGVYDALGQKEQALSYFEQALGIRREVGDRGGEGTTLNNLGGVYNDLGQKEQALRYYEQALGICREVGDRGGEGTTLNNLGLVYNDLGQKEKALSYYEQALGILREVGNRGVEGTTLNNLGLVYDDLGQKEQALSYFEQALGIRREVGDRGGEGVTLWNSGALYFGQGRYDVALACFLLARGVFEEVLSPYRDNVQKWIDDLRRKVGEEQFAALLAEVEPRAAQIVEQALREGL